ncbi:MAG: OadG family protein [Bacillota bacterium]
MTDELFLGLQTTLVGMGVTFLALSLLVAVSYLVAAAFRPRSTLEQQAAAAPGGPPVAVIAAAVLACLGQTDVRVTAVRRLEEAKAWRQSGRAAQMQARRSTLEKRWR